MIMPTDFTPFSALQRILIPTNLLDDVVATEIIDDSYHQFLCVLIHTHQQGIVNHVNDRQKESIVHDTDVKQRLC